MIEFSQAENLLNYVGEYLVEASITGEAEDRHGNRHPHRVPQGVYPCQEPDRWVTLSIVDDREWLDLVNLMGHPAWTRSDDLSTENGRRNQIEEIDRHVGEWTATQPQAELVRAARGLGLDVAPVLDEADLLADPQMAERRFYRENSSVDVPVTRFPGHLWQWDGPELAWGPLNRMGADNDYVYRELLGLDDEGMAALDAERHLSLDYLDANGEPL